jgi:cytochrome P450
LVIGVGHGSGEYWGEDADVFRPERFLEGGDSKAPRPGFQPFGGGMHLCPGRQFAFSEMVAVVATLLLGFDVEPLEGTEWKLPEFGTPSMIDAVTKPVKNGEGFGVKLTQRPGWEGVRWEYEM